MYKVFATHFNALILALIMLLTVLFGYPSNAYADKTIKAIAFDPAAQSVNVAEIYNTTPETQKTAIKSLKPAIKATKKATGFNGLTMLKSDDGTQLIVMSQWQDLASYQAYTAPTTAAKSEQKSTPAIAPTRTIVFEIAKSQTARENATPTLRGKEAIVQFSDFRLKNPTDSATVVSSVEKMIPAILLKQPAPQSVIELQSSDKIEVALMANWNCTADFVETGAPTSIDPPDSAISDLITVDQHTYNVIQLMPASKKTPKYEDS